VYQLITEIVKGSLYNIDPEARDSEIDDFLRTKLANDKKTLKDLETEIVTCPFVQIPVNVMEDRLFGSVDVKKTLETGDFHNFYFY
jgi:magnesium chelatase subunit D